MNNSIYLAQLMGPLLLVFGLYVALAHDRLVRLGREFLASEALMFISGALALGIGLPIVLAHNVWAADWRVLITLFGWIAIAAGVARLAFGTAMKDIGNQLLEKRAVTAIPGALMVLIGVVLCYFGYFG